MSSIADFEFNASPLCDGMILVSQLIRRDFPVADVERKLQQLVDEARAAVPVDITQEQQLDALIELFYKTWGFGGASGVYRLSDALWLDKVLEDRQGSAGLAGLYFPVGRAPRWTFRWCRSFSRRS